MPVVMVIAILVVLAAVVYVAIGRGGELSAERCDYAPLDLGPVSATDVALMHPPTGLWGYDRAATDEAMDRIAESIRERDVRIVALEQLVTDLGRDHVPTPLLASPYVGARHRRAPFPLAEPVQAAETVPPAETEEADEITPPWRPPATKPARPPFEQAWPAGGFVGPPERSHD
ncbi:MAG: hypothetical protein ACRDNS_23675 [Trebonia sp.]